MPAANADPWLIAAEALDALDRMRPLHRHQGRGLDDLDEVAELLRRLAWGPED